MPLHNKNATGTILDTDRTLTGARAHLPVHTLTCAREHMCVRARIQFSFRADGLVASWVSVCACRILSGLQLTMLCRAMCLDEARVPVWTLFLHSHSVDTVDAMTDELDELIGMPLALPISGEFDKAKLRICADGLLEQLINDGDVSSLLLQQLAALQDIDSVRGCCCVFRMNFQFSFVSTEWREMTEGG